MKTQERIDELKQCAAWETHVNSLEALALELDDTLCREREAHSKTREELEEIKEGMKFIMDEKCAESEVHCGCVPLGS